MKRFLLSAAAGTVFLPLLLAGAAPAAPAVSRTLPEPAVFIPGGEFPVAVTVSVGTEPPPAGVIVRETLPSGWSVAWPEASHDPSDNSWGFAFFALPADSFTFHYRVAVPAGEETPAGVISGWAAFVTEDGWVWVDVAGPATLARLAPAAGDVNRDGRVDGADAALALAMAAGRPVTVAGREYDYPYGELAERADLDGIPGVDVRDALLLMRIAAGL